MNSGFLRIQKENRITTKFLNFNGYPKPKTLVFCCNVSSLKAGCKITAGFFYYPSHECNGKEGYYTPLLNH